jgi:CMP-N-acetylneuraminic acid synthetase
VSLQNCYFLIPARMGSKGFPLKNRQLLRYTLDIIPEEARSRAFVSTDDSQIKTMAIDYGVSVIHRPENLAQDETSMKDVLKHFINNKNITCQEDVILLYLTYPERKWEDVEKIYGVFNKIDEKSLVCCEQVEEHPYLCFHEKDDNKAELIVDHKFYRRQDYPSCIRLSMFVSCYNPEIVDDLHDLMFEKETYFYKLENHKVDVDYLEQFLNISKEEN